MEIEVIRLIAQACGISPQDVRRDQLLLEYGLDSARAMDLLVALEDTFDLQISDDTAAKLRRVEDVIQLVSKRAR